MAKLLLTDEGELQTKSGIPIAAGFKQKTAFKANEFEIWHGPAC